MKKIAQIRLKAGMTVYELIKEFEKAPVLAHGRVYRAVKILLEMFRDDHCKKFLAFSGPIIAAGLRRVIGVYIERGLVDAIVTTGANITHDLIESLGYRHYKTKGGASKLGRIYDISVELSAYRALEKFMREVLEEVEADRKKAYSTDEFLRILASRIHDSESFLRKAAEHNVPVFCPSICDSVVGFHISTYSRRVEVNPSYDMNRLLDKIFSGKRIGVFIIGGGVPKHYLLALSAFKGGADYAVQITLDRPEGGSLSGAPLEEGITWGKIKKSARVVTVVGDATIVLPILTSALLEGIKHAA